MPYSLSELNQMSQSAFTAALGSIFEHTPTIAERTWQQRPFASLTALHQRLLETVAGLDSSEQLALIRAHPDLGSKAKMAEDSVQEQAGAGLDHLTAAEFQQFSSLNAAYRQKFGFPFIVAVKQQTKTSILAAFEQRLQHSPAFEQQQAIVEIGKIAWFRLQDRVQE